MTARGLLLALAVLASTPTEAASCHRYSVWRYPWPQRCGVARQAVWPILTHPGPTWPAPSRVNGPEIALPSLAQADLDGGEADEPTRARLMLRAALEAANAH
jgi:hypothetical protein